MYLYNLYVFQVFVFVLPICICIHLLELLQLSHILLERSKLLLVGDGILLQGSEGGLILLLKLALLQNLLLQLLVELLKLLQLGELLRMLLQSRLKHKITFTSKFLKFILRKSASLILESILIVHSCQPSSETNQERSLYKANLYSSNVNTCKYKHNYL